MDCSPTGSSIHGILQYLHGILEWVAVSFSRGSSWSSDQTISCIGKWILYHWATGKPICECAVLCLVTQLCPTLCDPMNGSPPGSSVRGDSLGREYWSGLPCPSPGDLPNPEIKLMSLMSPALAGGFFTTSTTCEAPEAAIVQRPSVRLIWHYKGKPICRRSC